MKRLNGPVTINDERLRSYDNNNNKMNAHKFRTESQEINTLNDDPLPLPKLTLLQARIVVAALSLLCFWNGQYAAFTFDDNSAILKNRDLLPETSVWSIFENDFWGTNIRSNLSHKSYRPITVLSFRLNYYLSEGFHPWGFHVVNIALHALHSVLLLNVFSAIFGGISTDEHGHQILTAPKASLLCGVLFAVHPVHTESVVAVVGRADLLCGIFTSFSFISYAKYTQIDSSQHWKHMLLSLLCAAIAMFSKEQGITVLGVCIAFEMIMILQMNLSVIISYLHQNGDVVLKKPLSTSIKRISVLALSAVFLLTLRLKIMASPPPSFQYNDNPHSFQDSIVKRVLNYNYLYSINLWLLLNPWWLCFDWAMGCIPVIQSFGDPRLLAPLFMWASLSGFVFKVVSVMDSHLGRCLAVSLAFLLIPFLPAMNIFFRVGFVIAERNLYISSIGFIMIITLGMLVISYNAIGKRVVKTGMFFLALLFIARCMQRTNDWLSEIDLFQSGLKVCPLNAKVHYNVGKSIQDSGNDDDAIKHYLEAIRLALDYDQPMNNLGNIYKDKKMFREAEYYHNMSVTVNPKFAAGWMNLGTIKADLKQKDEAIRCYEEAIKHRRRYPDAYYNWGNVVSYMFNMLLNIFIVHRDLFHSLSSAKMSNSAPRRAEQLVDFKELDKGIEKFKMAINLKNNHKSAWQNMITALGENGQGDELIAVASKVMKIFPADSPLIFVIGNSLGKAGKLKEAEPYMIKHLEQEPNNSLSYGNIAVLYHRLQDYEKADLNYKQALKLDPKNTFAAENYKKLLRVWKKEL